MMNLSNHVKKMLISHWGITATRIEKMRNGVINTNYRVISEQGEFLFKIYAFRTPLEITFEQKLLRILEQHHFPCPRVILTLEKKEYIGFQNKFSVLFEYINGKNKQNFSHEQLYKIGKLLGRLHTLLHDIKQTVAKNSWEPEDIRDLLVSAKKQIIEKKFPDAEERISFFMSELRKLHPLDSLPKGLTHQDVKPENIVISDLHISIIDFDNIYYGILLVDFMTPVIWMCFRGNTLDKKKYHQFRRGYEEERQLTSLEKKNVDNALRFRLIREAFVWSMQFNSVKARNIHEMFFNRYTALPKNLLSLLSEE